MTPDDPKRRARVLLGAIARRHRRASSGSQAESAGDASLEGAAAEAESMPAAADVTDRLRDAIDRVPQDERVDPEAFAWARERLLQQTAATLTKATARGPDTEFTANETMALEAVILTDGTRPSLMLRNNAVDPDHPFIGGWKDAVMAHTPRIARLAASVGRIESSPGAFFGTGSVVDDGKGLVLTNRHVLIDMWKALRDRIDVRRDRYRFVDGAHVDFVAEIGSAKRNRFKVVEGMFVGEEGEDLKRLDAALLKVRPLTAAEAAAEGQQAVLPLPRAVTTTMAADGALGQLTSFCVIGFPGQVPPPSMRQGNDLRVDWNWVAFELMGGRHGVKRFAPGTVTDIVGSLAGDDRQWCFGHDATTLGGNSGSPTGAWTDDGPPVFGLHFAGSTLERNYAHAYHAIGQQVQAAMVAM